MVFPNPPHLPYRCVLSPLEQDVSGAELHPQLWLALGAPPWLKPLELCHLFSAVRQLSVMLIKKSPKYRSAAYKWGQSWCLLMSTQKPKANPYPLVTELSVTSTQAPTQRPRTFKSRAIEVLLYFYSNSKSANMGAPSVVLVAWDMLTYFCLSSYPELWLPKLGHEFFSFLSRGYNA